MRFRKSGAGTLVPAPLFPPTIPLKNPRKGLGIDFVITRAVLVIINMGITGPLVPSLDVIM